MTVKTFLRNALTLLLVGILSLFVILGGFVLSAVVSWSMAKKADENLNNVHHPYNNSRQIFMGGTMLSLAMRRALTSDRDFLLDTYRSSCGRLVSICETYAQSLSIYENQPTPSLWVHIKTHFMLIVLRFAIFFTTLFTDGSRAYTSHYLTKIFGSNTTVTA